MYNQQQGYSGENLKTVARRQLAFDEDDEGDAAPMSADRLGSGTMLRGADNEDNGEVGSAPRTAVRTMNSAQLEHPHTQEVKGVLRFDSSENLSTDNFKLRGDYQQQQQYLRSPNASFSESRNPTDTSFAGGGAVVGGSPLARSPQHSTLFANPSSNAGMFSDDRNPGFGPRNIFAERSGGGGPDSLGRGGSSSREGSILTSGDEEPIPFGEDDSPFQTFFGGRGRVNHQSGGGSYGGGVSPPNQYSLPPLNTSHSGLLPLGDAFAGGTSPLNNVQPGRLLFEYSNHRDIGSGDFGTVVAATYDEDGVTYAIKSSKKAAVGERELQSRLQEVYALSAVSSPYLLRYYDAWIEQGCVSIKTEYLPDGAVRQLPKPWSEEQLWLLLLQVSLGLHALHSSNIAHLDVKPDNIFVELRGSSNGATALSSDNSGSVDDSSYPTYRLGDFGLARTLVDQSPVGEHFDGLNEDEGDCRYMCPELLKHSYSMYLMEADVYSLGASVVDLAGGDPVAFRNDGYTEFPLDYSDNLKSFLASMLNPHPPSRPTAFQVVEMTTKAIAQYFCPAGGSQQQQQDAVTLVDAAPTASSEFALLNHPQVSLMANEFQEELQQLEEEYQRLLRQQKERQENEAGVAAEHHDPSDGFANSAE